jgi:predicted small lipoprotein YifL
MKKFMLFVAVFAVCALAACGGKKVEEAPVAAEVAEVSQDTTTATPTAEVTTPAEESN